MNLDGARLLVGAVLLLYGSATDLATRRVPNRTWLVGGAIGLLFLGVDAAVLGRWDVGYLLAIPVIMALAYGFWYVHLIAGGADAKAIMMLALLLPWPLAFEVGGRVFPLWPGPFPPAVVAFANSLLAFLVVPILFFALNAARGDVRFPTMLLGYRMPIDEAASSFVWVTEQIDEHGHPSQLLMSSKQSAEEMAANIERLRAAGRKHVWVTPKIPFIVPLFAGFLLTFFVGDVLTHAIAQVVGPSP